MDLTYKDLVDFGTIGQLTEVEKDFYISYHQENYKEDIKISQSLMTTSPKWSVVAGYYAMHNLAKLFLAKKFNIKVAGKYIHEAVIEALKKHIGDGTVRNKLLELLDKSRIEFELIGLNLEDKEILPFVLSEAKRERSKVQYYKHYNISKKVATGESKKFSDSIVQPFVKIVLELM